jgi:hypothetical protein
LPLVSLTVQVTFVDPFGKARATRRHAQITNARTIVGDERRERNVAGATAGAVLATTFSRAENRRLFVVFNRDREVAGVAVATGVSCPCR